MPKFFINRPIVAMVIAIIMTIVGAVAYLTLPVAQYPEIVPPQIQVSGQYVGADALTVEQSVATPIEQQMSGVDDMQYMYSLSSNDGRMTLRVNFNVASSPNIDHVLAQMRSNQADSQLPVDVRNVGVTVIKSTASPLMVISLLSPESAYDEIFLANYAYINLNDALLRVPGIGQVQVFGAGQYAMRLWVRPDTLAKMNITVPEIMDAVKKQNTVNPAGRIGDEPAPAGQEFTFTVRTQGRLVNPEEFGEIVVRAYPDGSVVRLKDVARIELGAQDYNLKGKLNNKPAAVIAVYQTPGTNAIKTAEGVRKLMQEASQRFPQGMEYVINLDTTLPVTEGINEIIHTLIEAIVLVLLVVYIFLQNVRATLIPALAVPVSLVGTLAVFPLLGFSINTLSLLGLVLAVGLVVDDAIVVVEATEHHIEHGLAPREATLKAMEEVTGPVIATALVLVGVFLPTVFIPGITGRLYQQFAVTIVVSVSISAFNALSLSPALSALLLRPRQPARGPLGKFFVWFNRVFDKAANGYTAVCGMLIRKMAIGLLLLVVMTVGIGVVGKQIPTGFLPEEDQGYFFVNVALPTSSSLQRTEQVTRKVGEILSQTPGVEYVCSVVGFSMLSQVNVTYNGFFFVTLKNWADRKSPDQRYEAIMDRVNAQLMALPEAVAFGFSPPAIPGIGTSGGVTLVLEDRAGKDMAFLAANTQKFLAAARQRPEIGNITTSLTPSVPQIMVNVDRDKVLKQEVDLGSVYQTVQAFMGGSLINYFNRFGRQWQVYLQAEGQYRNNADNLGQFYVRNSNGDPVPLSTLINVADMNGPEFSLRYNLFRGAQINAMANPGYSSTQVMKALEEVFSQTMPSEMGYDYLGMSFEEKRAQEGISPMVIFALAALFAFLIMAAQYESWSLPLSVLLGTPIAIFGAMASLLLRGFENNIYAQIGFVMLIGLAAKNAILIVEFAKQEHEKGKDIMTAALEGARLRLRPILMTALAFILGCVPLWVAAGSGALARKIIGTCSIGGMAAATAIAIFIIPLTYYVVARLAGGRKHGPPPGDAAAPRQPGAEVKS